MDRQRKWAGWLVLALILVITAVALGVTYAATRDPIAQQSELRNQEALLALFPEAGANGFASLGGTAYEVTANGQTVGYVSIQTQQGYAGPVEVTVGLEAGGAVRGIAVGGSDFQETEGLGAKAKDPAFTDQFAGKTPPLALGTDIQAISGATVTSQAVVDAVNAAAVCVGK